MKQLITLLFALLPFTVSAQEQVRVPQFGYLSYNTVFQSMPEYKQAQADFAALKAKYDAEATRAEEEFQRKFTEFLNGQKDFPQSIMLKRQAELQDLMDRSIAFRKESSRLLAEAEARMQAPIASQLNQAIYEVAAERGLIYVLNTDGNAVPFVHPQVGVDITEAVKQKLGIKEEQAEKPQEAQAEQQSNEQ
jgi:outer membrane protein